MTGQRKGVYRKTCTGNNFRDTTSHCGIKYHTFVKAVINGEPILHRVQYHEHFSACSLNKPICCANRYQSPPGRRVCEYPDKKRVVVSTENKDERTHKICLGIWLGCCACLCLASIFRYISLPPKAEGLRTKPAPRLDT